MMIDGTNFIVVPKLPTESIDFGDGVAYRVLGQESAKGMPCGPIGTVVWLQKTIEWGRLVLRRKEDGSWLVTLNHDWEDVDG